jgi:hypothetical protein
MKITLSEYSIGADDKGLFEQYKSSDGCIKEIVNSSILQQFSNMGAQSKGLGSLAAQSLIDDYNSTTKERISK